MPPNPFLHRGPFPLGAISMAGSDITVTSEDGRIWAGARHLAIGALVALGLVAALSALACAQTEPPASGDWVVADPTAISGREVLLDGNLTVTGTGSLTLTDVDLVLDVTTPGGLAITVEAGGTLHLYDKDHDGATGGDATTVSSADPSMHYKWTCQAGSHLLISASTVRDCGHAEKFPEYTGDELPGLVIGTDDALVENSTFMGCVFGICADNAAPVIRDSTFMDNELCGVYITFGATRVERCSFSNSSTCVLSRSNIAIIKRCTCEDSAVGVLIRGTRGSRVTDCTVNSCGEGINVSASASVIVEGARIEECTNGLIIEKDGLILVGNCTIRRSSSYGVVILRSSVNLTNVVIESSGAAGIFGESSSYNLMGCTLRGNVNAGVNDSKSAMHFYTTTFEDTHGDHLALVNRCGAWLFNCTFGQSDGLDIWLHEMSGLRAYNMTVDFSDVKVDDKAGLHIMREWRARVVDDGGKAPSSPVHLEVRDARLDLIFNATLGPDAKTAWAWNTWLLYTARGLLTVDGYLYLSPYNTTVTVGGKTHTSRLDLNATLDQVITIPGGGKSHKDTPGGWGVATAASVVMVASILKLGRGRRRRGRATC